ncbi:MAG: hypothetical protein COW05_04560, partial [Gammaproteobacteria bacterium CG12_big_fil_rev_8_21_14_0_65_46_12]
MKEKFIGTWRLVHSIEIDEHGQKHYPFGDDAVGYIIYDAKGTMAVQITRRNRQAMNAKSLKTASVDELKQAAGDYLAYFGQYTIDEENETVDHDLEGCLFPNRVGQILKRKYTFLE